MEIPPNPIGPIEIPPNLIGRPIEIPPNPIGRPIEIPENPIEIKYFKILTNAGRALITSAFH